MDHRSMELMDDPVFEGKGKSNNIQNPSKGPKKDIQKKSSKIQEPVSQQKSMIPKSNRKVELQTLRVTAESEKQLYETLKHIYGASFKLSEASEFKNKKSNLQNQFWTERGNLVIREVFDYSSKDTTPKTHLQMTKHIATSKLESYSFHSNHCLEALTHTDGDFGRALEILFEKYFRINDLPKICEENMDTEMLMSMREDERLTLDAIYNEAFEEKIKNQLWRIKLKLDYLIDNKENENKKKEEEKPKKKPKEICNYYLSGKCRYGLKCKYLHQRPEPVKVQKNVSSSSQDPYFTLEIRFPKDSKYPYEPPYFYFYKNQMVYPSLQYLLIVKRLYTEANLLCTNGDPHLFELISMLENEEEMMEYLTTADPNFIDKNESLFSKSLDMDFETLSTHHQKGSTNRSSREKLSSEELEKLDDTICSRFMEKQSNQRYQKMISSRRKLPAWSQMTEIIETIEDNQVTIISGETGCGKSTQVPQFLLDDWIVNRSAKKEHAEIICTQPRRISAIGVAERVSAERDERIGNTVGYQIRLESKMSNWTRLAFCTTGILLQRISGDPFLKTVTHVIVDEVHERSAESDFLLMLLREILPKRPDLKIILMSATLKAEGFSTYFKGTPVLNIPGRTFPVEPIFLEDIIEQVHFVFEENSKYCRRVRGGYEAIETELETADVECSASVAPKNTILDENLTLAQLMGRYPGYEKQTYKNLYVMDHDKINFELIEKILEWIVDGNHELPTEGSILVFLPGLAEISMLRDSLNNNSIFSPKTGRFKIIPLHSTLSSEEQSLVFKKPEHGIRKIVLSTNIAETSVTIDDCVFVIDSGRMKETRFNSNQNMASLETCWVSRANAMQRRGRAGRVRPGVCIHLYTFHRFQHHLLAEPVPEILRIPLEPLLLRIQIMRRGKKIDLYNILKRIIEPPAEQNILDSITRLQDVGAFDSEYDLTPLGHHLAALPVDVRIGKLILYGAIFCCVDSALTIAACLSHKSPFSTPFDKRHLVDAKRKEYSTAFSDQLTILKAYKKYIEMARRSYHAAQAFAYENCLSVRTLQTLADIKHQLLELLVSIGFVPVDIQKRQMGVDKVVEITGNELNVNNENTKLLQGLLCAALYPNVVRICTPEKSFQIQASGAIPRQPKPEELRFQTKNDGFVFVHPSSVNFSVGHFPSPYLVYQEKVKTSKVFIREISMVSMMPLILFSGYGVNIEQHNGAFVLSLADGWILFAVESHTVAQLLRQMRIELVKLLEQKMQDPLLNLVNHQNGRKIIRTIISVLSRE